MTPIEPEGKLFFYNPLHFTIVYFKKDDFIFIYKQNRTYHMKPVITEIYPGTQESASYSVAVVKTNSGINRLEDLRDKRSCHTGYGRTAGNYNHRSNSIPPFFFTNYLV